MTYLAIRHGMVKVEQILEDIVKNPQPAISKPKLVKLMTEENSED